MLDKVLGLFGSHLSEILLTVLIAALGFGLRLLRQLPDLLLAFAKGLEAEAAKTADPKDDLVAKLLLAFASALKAALEKTLGKA